MLRLTRFRPQNMLSALLSTAGCAGLLPAAVLADDCSLSLQASPRVVSLGQTTRIKVFACPSNSGVANAPYAFASAAFDVLASAPQWSSASDGVIVDSDVVQIKVGQVHQPQSGIFADPSNPIQVWEGIFKPASAAAALIEIDANPTEFSVYPSKFSPSSASCDAAGGRDWVFANPQSVGKWLAAPGSGTSTTVADDVIVDGRIITGENYDSAILIGLLLPAVQKVEEAEVRVAFDGQPEAFSATVQTERDSVPTSSFSLNFAKIEFDSAHPGGMNVCLSDGSVRHVSYGGFLGGVYVASGDLDHGAPAPNPSLIVESIPQVIGVRVVSGLGDDSVNAHLPGTYGGATNIKSGLLSPVLSGSSMLTWTLRYDEPVKAVVRGPNGQPQIVTVDRIEVRASIAETARKISSSNNLKQIGLACHVFESTGADGMRLMPKQPE